VTVQQTAGGRKVLVTGGAGFIGSHLTDCLLELGDRVVVLDNFNRFYDPRVKRRNVRGHLDNPLYLLIEGDLRDEGTLDKVFEPGEFDVVVHLAAMAGVRPSLSEPALYMDVNVLGTQRLLDRIMSHSPGTRLVFGSSSSVYGKRSGECFRESDRTDQPLSPYAASKVAGEALCYAAHNVGGLPVVCLRFFTVFGPRQRPDLAIHRFCKLIDAGQPVEVFGDGSSRRDYTYISDIVAGILAAMTYDLPGYDIINLGRSDPVVLMEMIRCLEAALGKKANLVHQPMPPGEMPYTYADTDKAHRALGFAPRVSFEDGIRRFVDWYRSEKACSTSSPL
jgi:UDP-glucuronate 4-epimerase